MVCVITAVSDPLSSTREGMADVRFYPNYVRFIPRGLGPVDNYLAAMIAATRFRFALKLVSVLSYLVAIPRNSLILAK